MKALEKQHSATTPTAADANQAPARAIKRRQFLKSTALIGAGGMILPRLRLFGQDAPSNKLNIALLGTWGRGEAHFDVISRENVVALCDVNEKHLAFAAEKFPKATQYVDWRKCLEQKDIDAVMCCTLDHTHAFIANWAMNRGKHVYCEKPLANSVEEARVIRATWVKNKDKLATQVGTQRHEFKNFNRVRELIRDGAIGELQGVSAWGDRQIRRPGYLAAQGDPPEYLHYDLWLGPSPFHPYNPGYFSGGSGMNCLQWNMYWDFGSGQVGDMGSHTMDLAWNAIDGGLPTSAEGKGDPFNPEVTPVRLEMHFEIPSNDWRPAMTVSWYQGGAMPESPNRAIDLKKIDHGAMFEGSKGFLVADFQSRVLFPLGNDADLTYYKPRTKETLIAPMGVFQRQWINACKGSLKTSCDFGYGSDMIEMMLLGLVAYRVGKKIKYDGATGEVSDCAEANPLLKHSYREGWTLNG
jgi:predicted dehydrogenase